LQDKFLAPPRADGAPWAAWTYADERAAAGAIDSVSVTGTFGDKVVLKLGPMDQPIAALQACVDDLMKQWGLDPRRLVAASRQAEPTADPRTWLSKSDYPREMRAVGRGGAALARLVIDEQGQVARCIAGASEAAVGETTCNALRERARFMPALDAEGKPMTGLYVTQVRFVPVGTNP
jgi:hypothetical protein